MDALIVIIIFGFIAIGVIVNIYNHTSHSKTNGKILKKDASICNIETKNVGGRKMVNGAIRTVVTFDDGFVYISHKCKHALSFFQATISVDAEVIEEIKKDAVIAHEKALKKQNPQPSNNCILTDEKNCDILNSKKDALNTPINTRASFLPEMFPDLFPPPYFEKLFKRISFLKNYEKTEQIEFAMFSLYKSNLFLWVMLKDSKLSEEQQEEIIGNYGLYESVSFDRWLKENAFDFNIDTNLLIKRFDSYDKALRKNLQSDRMKMIELTLYWFLQYDVAFEGKEPDMVFINSNEFIESAKQKYFPVYNCLDSLVFEFCKNNLSELVLFYAKNLTVSK